MEQQQEYHLHGFRHSCWSFPWSSRSLLRHRNCGHGFYLHTFNSPYLNIFPFSFLGQVYPDDFFIGGDPGFLSVCITSPVFTPVMLFSKCPTFCEKGTIVIPCPFHWPASNFRLKMVVRACRIPCIRKWNKKEQGRWWGRGAVAALPPPLHMWYANYHFSVGSATGELKQGVKPRKC
jgi:hypothetical protein